MGQRYNDNTKWPKLRENQLGILETYALCLKIQQSASGPGGVLLELLSIYLSMRIHSKSYHIFPLKVAATLLT